MIRISDQPIFRVYKKKWFLPILNNGNDTLINPSKWDDPFENFFLTRTLVEAQSTTDEPEYGCLKSLARDWYGQCWTTNSDTDAMWRMYSPCKDGIQVKTTIRKLFENLEQQVPQEKRHLQCFVGRVEYLTMDKIKEMMDGLKFADVAREQSFADLLCIKREAFNHESEVRILFHDIDKPGRGLNGTFNYPLTANDIFQEIVVDPRLNVAEAKMVGEELRGAGCKIPIRRSDLYYDGSYFIIPLN
jgi:hypothetical protein